jgi:hypothetical protein
MNDADKVEVEYCYSGFMGYPLVIFIWSKDGLLLSVICRDEKGKFVSRPGTKTISKEKMNKGERFWNWFQKIIVMIVNEL